MMGCFARLAATRSGARGPSALRCASRLNERNGRSSASFEVLQPLVEALLLGVDGLGRADHAHEVRPLGALEDRPDQPILGALLALLLGVERPLLQEVGP